MTAVALRSCTLLYWRSIALRRLPCQSACIPGGNWLLNDWTLLPHNVQTEVDIDPLSVLSYGHICHMFLAANALSKISRIAHVYRRLGRHAPYCSRLPSCRGPASRPHLVSSHSIYFHVSQHAGQGAPLQQTWRLESGQNVVIIQSYTVGARRHSKHTVTSGA